jgi:hypothetical protein
MSSLLDKTILKMIGDKALSHGASKVVVTGYFMM